MPINHFPKGSFGEITDKILPKCFLNINTGVLKEESKGILRFFGVTLHWFFQPDVSKTQGA